MPDFHQLCLPVTQSHHVEPTTYTDNKTKSMLEHVSTKQISYAAENIICVKELHLLFRTVSAGVVGL